MLVDQRLRVSGRECCKRPKRGHVDLGLEDNKDCRKRTAINICTTHFILLSNGETHHASDHDSLRSRNLGKYQNLSRTGRISAKLPEWVQHEYHTTLKGGKHISGTPSGRSDPVALSIVLDRPVTCIVVAKRGRVIEEDNEQVDQT